MEPTERSIALAHEFAPVSRAAWEAAAGDLDLLRSTTYDGLRLEPLYSAGDALDLEPAGLPGFAPFVRGRTPASTRTRGWDVRQAVSPADGARAAIAELERGATSLLLRLRDQPAIDSELVAGLLDGVLLDVAPVVLDAGPRWGHAATALAELWAGTPGDAAGVSGSLGADPFGEWASDRSGVDLDAQLGDAAAWSARLSGTHPAMRTVTIDGTRYHDAGASDAQELGLTIAAAVATLGALVDERHGGAVSIADGFGQIELRLAATAEQFATIAKFRAVRRMWARVAEIAGRPDAAASSPIHAMSSTAMMTRYDPAVNMLRATVACFAAGVAGADAITVRPYDDLLHDGGSELGHRLARNTQSILAMESHLSRVIDPAGGSWYVERLTGELAEAAWACFQEVEQAGGFRNAVAAGLVDEHIARVRERRSDDIDHRRLLITGVSEFPNIGETPPPTVDTAPTAPTPPTAPTAPNDGSLARHRWAEGFEQLRQRVDAFAETSGARPTVLLATLGKPAAFTTRAMFAKNFFEIAGVATRHGPVTSDPAEIAAAMQAQPASVVCLCSDDATYAESGAAAAAAVTAAGASRVYLAGRPRRLIESLEAAGVTHTISAGCDARAVLTDLVEHLLPESTTAASGFPGTRGAG